jgi:transposase InsO family protein
VGLGFPVRSNRRRALLKLLNVVDEFTREALAMHVARSIDADQTVTVLERLTARRGAPTRIRCDNGPALTAHALRDWCRYSRAATAFIEPGARWQNAYVESFNPRARRTARPRAIQRSSPPSRISCCSNQRTCSPPCRGAGDADVVAWRGYSCWAP